MITKDIQVLNKLGLHARAAAKLVFIANKFVSDITLVKDDKRADARSIMKILMLSASIDSIINITVAVSYTHIRYNESRHDLV